MNFGISVSTFPTSFGPIMFSGDLESKLPRIAEIGYSHLDLFIKSAHEPGIESLIHAISANGLQVALLAAVSAYVDDGLYLSSPDDYVRHEMVERMQTQIELASELNAMVPIGLLRGSESGEDRYGYLAESLFRLAEVANPLGVELIIEPVNRYETRLINSLSQAVEFCHHYQLPNYRLLPDVFHMNIEEVSIEVAFRKHQTRIAHVHFADSNRGVPGRGHLNWSSILQTLKAINYSGVCSIEAIPGDDAEKDAREGIQLLNRYVELL
jgi:sugar phosphate isomerase/epimerase